AHPAEFHSRACRDLTYTVHLGNSLPAAGACGPARLGCNVAPFAGDVNVSFNVVNRPRLPHLGRLGPPRQRQEPSARTTAKRERWQCERAKPPDDVHRVADGFLSRPLFVELIRQRLGARRAAGAAPSGYPGAFHVTASVYVVPSRVAVTSSVLP